MSTRIVVIVRGGNVESIFGSSPSVDASVIDVDNLKADNDEAAYAEQVVDIDALIERETEGLMELAL